MRKARPSLTAAAGGASSSKTSVRPLNKLDGENIIGIKTKKGTAGRSERAEETRKCPEVEAFLEEIGMQKYLSTFVNNGFEDLETMLELRDEDFTVLGLPLGHKLKILKKIKELRPELKPEVKPELKPENSSETQITLIVKEAGKVEKTVRFEKEPVVIEIDKEPKKSSHETAPDNEFKTPPKVSQKTIEKTDTETSTNSNSERGSDVVFLKTKESKESCWNCYKLFVKGKGCTDPLTENVTPLSP